MYEVQHKNNKTDAVVLLIYIIWKIIWDNPRSLNTDTYEAATVQSNGTDHFLYECSGPLSFLLYLFYNTKWVPSSMDLILGKRKNFQCIDCHFVFWSHVHIQVSSQAISDFKKSGSFRVHCKRPEKISSWSSFCSANSIFGTIFAQTFSMFNSSVKIIKHLPSKLTISTVARTRNLRCFHITSHTF